MKKAILGKTGLNVTRIALGTYPFAGINRAQNWNPYSADGIKEVHKTINTALDLGINYIDTAPGYGNGHSERLIGDVLKQRRDECYVATKVNWENTTAENIIKSCEDSLKRLQCETIDVYQFHGGRYTNEDFEFIMNEPLEGMLKLRKAGKIRFIGITAEEAWTAIPFINTEAFDVVQVCYNIIYQSAALHLLNTARDKNIGVTVMRPLTSGILQRALENIQPEWLEKSIETCLSFVLSDSRIHMANVGMRWSDEVRMNADFLKNFNPNYDLADIPRMTQKIYESDDKRNIKNAD